MELIFRNDLNTELSQKLTLTPEMIQSLNVLQYSRGELVDYMYDMMMENPVIELEDPDYVVQQPVSDASADSDDYDADYDSDGESESIGQELGENSDKEWDAEDWYNYAENMGYDDENYYGRNTYDTQDSDRYDYMVADDMTLEENLLNQVEMTGAPYMTRAIAAYIIQTLDDKC